MFDRVVAKRLLLAHRSLARLGDFGSNRSRFRSTFT
jgi:hypothetical protein